MDNTNENTATEVQNAELDKSLSVNDSITGATNESLKNEIDEGPKQINSKDYEKFDYGHKGFWNTTFGKILKTIGGTISAPITWVFAAVRNLCVTLGMDSQTRQMYYKEMSEQAAIKRENAVKETPYVANKKMEILNNDSLDSQKKLEKLATLCHQTGRTFYVVLNDMSALEFRKNEQYVEICFSEKPHKIKDNQYESYVFGTPLGNARFKTKGNLINSQKPASVNFSTVLARLDERNGFNDQIDSLKQNAQIVELNSFAPKKGMVEVKEENPGHEDKAESEENKEQKQEEKGEKTPESIEEPKKLGSETSEVKEGPFSEKESPRDTSILTMENYIQSGGLGEKVSLLMSEETDTFPSMFTAANGEDDLVLLIKLEEDVNVSCPFVKASDGNIIPDFERINVLNATELKETYKTPEDFLGEGNVSKKDYYFSNIYKITDRDFVEKIKQLIYKPEVSRAEMPEPVLSSEESSNKAEEMKKEIGQITQTDSAQTKTTTSQSNELFPIEKVEPEVETSKPNKERTNKNKDQNIR